MTPSRTRGGRIGVALWLAGVLGPAVGCATDDDPKLPPGTCPAVVWGQPQRAGEPLAVRGSWDDWERSIALRDFVDDDAPEVPWQVAELALPPGAYGYLLIEEGRGHLDRYEPVTTFREDGLEVSRLEVPDCQQPRLELGAVHEDAPDGFAVELSFEPALDGAPLDPAKIQAELADGTPLALERVDAEAGTASFRARALPRGKHRVRATATDAEGRPTEPVVGVGWVDPVAPQWADGIVYQIMIDRYRGDGGTVLAPPPDPGARAGGTLDGVLAELRAGTFDALGVSALWLSPVYLNPTEAREGRDDDHLYEGYHGYWPLDARAVDPRIGGEAALRALVDEAHARGIRVLLDLVPNHLYEDNPRVAEHRAEGWFHEHEPACICGSPSCSWAEFIEVCWFTPYLPDLRFEHPEVMELAVQDALWWHDSFDTDGFRIDAIPMMPRAVSRRLVHELREATAPQAAAFTMGEIFTGPGPGGTEVIRYYLGPDGLDSAFDFPLMWVVRDALAHQSTGLSAIEASLANTERRLEGSGALMATMIGNHDVTRFASEADGEVGSPWDDPPPPPVDPDVYARTGLALALVLTLPGLPVIYYGDEVGLAGGADPDNRRVMPELASLPPASLAALDLVERVARLRRCVPALRRGDRRALLVERDHYVFTRDAGDGAPAVVLLSREPVSATLELPAGSTAIPGWYKDALSGERVELGPWSASIEMEPRSLRVLVPESLPCP
ncbi:alpha-amylase family glycosyl hydrolase [Paraliomyxa miuraensis]|uniref:alpha-amylase family glycosyl hydrolase n=1 Tax=Paraliomyxa miuraensis TaxID=376150 RepID=UPI002254EE2B|nr:alpha-amylase family glycosyl hydrolase [Paraliomyxa miuraensis]MCX4246756.1 alpha-amylase family glycosyl hydrolase [Paraliomyxa miuraensis]